MEANENMPLKFYCESCDYGCCKKSSWNQHLMTAKHSKAKNGLMPANKIYACENCDMTFKHQSSYCRHKKKCIIDKNTSINENNILDKELFIMLVKQNTELMELLKNNSSTQANHNTNSLNNNNNKTFKS